MRRRFGHLALGLAPSQLLTVLRRKHDCAASAAPPTQNDARRNEAGHSYGTTASAFVMREQCWLRVSHTSLAAIHVSSAFVCGNLWLGEYESEGRKSRPSRPTPLRPSGLSDPGSLGTMPCCCAVGEDRESRQEPKVCVHSHTTHAYACVACAVAAQSHQSAARLS